MSGTYSNGTLAVENGSTSVVLTGGLFIPATAKPFDAIAIDDDAMNAIASIEDPTHATLARPYQGADNAVAPYMLWHMPVNWGDQVSLEEDVAEYLRLLGTDLPKAAEASRQFVTPQQFGARGDGIRDDTQSIIDAIEAAFAQGRDVFIPRTSAHYRLAAAGTVQSGDGSWIRCLIPLRPGVSILSDGALLKLTTGRTNPPGIFGHWRTRDDSINNIEIAGLQFEGGWEMVNPALTPLTSRYAFANYKQSVNLSSGTPWDVTQLSHCINILKCSNVHVHHVRFRNFLGYAVCLGDNYAAPTTRYFGAENCHVSEFDIENCFHGGIFLPSAWGGTSCHHGLIHGDGFMVGGIDIERHNDIDETSDVSVHHVVFDFRNSYGGIHPQYGYGRSGLWMSRRGVAIGYFGMVNDQISRGHSVTDCTFYQGCIEVYGQKKVTIARNRFDSVYEDLSAAMPLDLITAHAIRVFGDHDIGLSAQVTDNRIEGDIQGFGIYAYNCELNESGNTIIGPRAGGVYRQYCGGSSIGSTIRNIGLETAPAAAMLVDGTKGPTLISALNVSDNRVTVIPPSTLEPHFGTRAAVRLMGAMQFPPKISGLLVDPSQLTTGKIIEDAPANVGAYQEWGNGIGPLTTQSLQLGSGAGSPGLNMVSGEDETAFVSFWNGGFDTPRVFMGSPGDNPFGFIILAFKEAGGADLVFNFDGAARTLDLNLFGNGVTISGEWDAPLSTITGKKMWADPSGTWRTKQSSPTSATDGNRLVELQETVPASATAFGRKGWVAADADYAYFCVANDTWVRAPLSSW